MADITVVLDHLMEWYDDGSPLEGEDLEEWAKHARKAVERAKNEFMGKE